MAQQKANPVPARSMWIALVELCIAYGLILATIWTPRPAQRWLYLSALAWIVLSTWWSFPGWSMIGCRIRGFRGSAWVVGVALLVMGGTVAVAEKLHTLHRPHGAIGWVLAFGGYATWAFLQQFLLQGYFLLRFRRLLSDPRWAAVCAASLFAVAHLPNPILTPVTLVWGLSACFIFLRWGNLYPLGIAHALFGICLAISVPGPVLHNMRVGLGYLVYHAPRQPHLGPTAGSATGEPEPKGPANRTRPDPGAGLPNRD